MLCVQFFDVNINNVMSGSGLWDIDEFLNNRLDIFNLLDFDLLFYYLFLNDGLCDDLFDWYLDDLLNLNDFNCLDGDFNDLFNNLLDSNITVNNFLNGNFDYDLLDYLLDNFSFDCDNLFDRFLNDFLDFFLDLDVNWNLLYWNTDRHILLSN